MTFENSLVSQSLINDYNVLGCSQSHKEYNHKPSVRERVSEGLKSVSQVFKWAKRA